MSYSWNAFLSRLRPFGANPNNRSSRKARRKRPCALTLEQLEDRTVPSFMLQYSTDGGSTWSNQISDNGTGRITALRKLC